MYFYIVSFFRAPATSELRPSGLTCTKKLNENYIFHFYYVLLYRFFFSCPSLRCTSREGLTCTKKLNEKYIFPFSIFNFQLKNVFLQGNIN